ncbi:MAG: hypothetical protein ABR511_11250 [Acidimicrobiales bacterium]
MAVPRRADDPATGPVATDLSDEDLAALALSADPDAAVGDDAVCLWDVLEPADTQLLPGWYMPPPVGRFPGRWQRWVTLLIIVSFLAIDAYGLCSTYGQVVRA